MSPRDPANPASFLEEEPRPDPLENLPWTGITVLLAVLGLLLFMAVPMGQPTAQEKLQAQRSHRAEMALESLQRALEDYHADHAEWPGLDPATAMALGPAIHEEDWLRRQLELASGPDGSTRPVASPSHPFGPYLPNGIPTNPANGLDSIRVLGEGETFEGVVDDLYGWVYDPRSGELRPHDPPFQQSPEPREGKRRGAKRKRR